MRTFKIVAAIFCLFIFSVVSSWAQFDMLGAGTETREGVFNGGVGITTIENETYLTITLHPEIALGKFGIGLNINLLYNTKDGSIRSKDWDESYDYFRMIRYIRYGWKGDKFYTRLGTLDGSRLGHGFIMNYYTNEAEYDERKVGLVLDADFGQFGFESITSNLGRLEIIGGRCYVRPLYATNYPVIKNLGFGATYVTDVDPDKNRNSKDGISEWGLDVELPLISTKALWLGIYGDYAKIVDYGSGQAFGGALHLKRLLGLLTLEARLERRILGEKFLASYFDAFYEIDRYVPPSHKEDVLDTTKSCKGIFGQLRGKIINQIELIGNFQRLDDQPKSGILHLGADATKLIPGLALTAAYDKKNIETFKDVRTLDNRSVARVSVGYKIKPYLILYMDYIWSFVFDKDQNRYVSQERYAPRLAFNYNFSL